MFSLLKRVNWLSLFLSRLHSNIYLMIGTYGILIILLITLSIHWFFHANLNPIYVASLPPAWAPNGDINHILGTNKHGQDIFDYLLIGYRSTTAMTMKAMFYIIVLGASINYMLFFIAILRTILLFILRLLTTIPPLLCVIMISLLLDDNITNMLIAVSLAYMPRFIYNIHQQIIKESNKTYITAYRLDGLSSFTIFNHCIIPNIISTYLTEIVTLLGQMILAITTLTFLGFANDQSRPDLGMMMFQMKNIINTNYWAFLSPGLTIAITITLVYFLSYGLHNQRNRS